MKQATIVSVDSGLGGLSVVAEIRRAVPNQRHVYVCDNAYFPYGVRNDGELRRHFLNVMSAVLDAHKPDVVVAACNTISTLCLPDLRGIAKAPVVGVVPAIKPAAAASARKIVGLLATPATIERDYTDRLIEEFAPDCRVIRVGSAALVDMAEGKLRGLAPDMAAIARILAPFFERPASEQPDVVVLACTHFPLLRDELRASAPGDVQWIDSGGAIARRVRQLLGSIAGGSTCAGEACEDLAIATSDPDPGLKHALSQFGFRSIETLPVR